MPDDDKIPELPFEITVGPISMIHQDWWEKNPNALRDAEDVAAWLDFHIERRTAGETKSGKPVERLTLTVEQAAEALGIDFVSPDRYRPDCFDRYLALKIEQPLVSVAPTSDRDCLLVMRIPQD